MTGLKQNPAYEPAEKCIMGVTGITANRVGASHGGHSWSSIAEGESDMQKVTRVVAAGMAGVVVMASALVAGCKMNPDQIAALSQAAGTSATIVWISYDNPSQTQKAEVSQVLSMVQTNIGIVGTNSYVAVLYPKVVAYVTASTNIPAIDQPLVEAGALAILGGVDMMFASNPTWKTDTQQVGTYVSAFITGAKVALALPANDPQIVSATDCNKARVGLKR